MTIECSIIKVIILKVIMFHDYYGEKEKTNKLRKPEYTQMV